MSVPAGSPGTPTINTKWRLDIDTAADPATPTWAQVRGMSEFSPSVDTTTQDSSDYDNEGWGSDAATLRKWSCQATFMRKTYSDGSAEAYDVGQEALRTAADTLDLVHARWYERGVPGGEAYEGYALVKWNPQGGGVEGLSTVQTTLMGQGGRTAITTPVIP